MSNRRLGVVLAAVAFTVGLVVDAACPERLDELDQADEGIELVS